MKFQSQTEILSRCRETNSDSAWLSWQDPESLWLSLRFWQTAAWPTGSWRKIPASDRPLPEVRFFEAWGVQSQLTILPRPARMYSRTCSWGHCVGSVTKDMLGARKTGQGFQSMLRKKMQSKLMPVRLLGSYTMRDSASAGPRPEPSRVGSAGPHPPKKIIRRCVKEHVKRNARKDVKRYVR